MHASTVNQAKYRPKINVPHNIHIILFLETILQANLQTWVKVIEKHEAFSTNHSHSCSCIDKTINDWI